MIRKATDPESLAEFATDESGIVHASNVEAVCFPESEQEICELLIEANETGTLVTTSGAGTGLNGGRVAVHGGVVIATQDLRTPQPRELPALRAEQFGQQYSIYVDEDCNEAYVPAGVSTELLDQMLPDGLLYPPDPTEKSGFIGANIACNASGARTFHYGASRHWVLGLRVVLPNINELPWLVSAKPGGDATIVRDFNTDFRAPTQSHFCTDTGEICRDWQSGALGAAYP